MNTQYQNFGEFLQRKRTEKQITLRKMAEMIGITAPYLTDIEKDRRNPPEMEKLELISQILMLNDEDKTTMYDLAGKKRNSVAPDLPDYIMEHDYVSAALRTARDLDASEADWLKFVEELRPAKGVIYKDVHSLSSSEEQRRTDFEQSRDRCHRESVSYRIFSRKS